MGNTKQIFQTSSRFRWHTYRWTGRLILAILVLMIPAVWIAVAQGYKPLLPFLSENNYVKLSKAPVQPKSFSKQDNKRYQGFHQFLKSHQPDHGQRARSGLVCAPRAGD